jgi:hypothetical protein
MESHVRQPREAKRSVSEMKPFRVDLTDFVTNGRFGTFDRNTNRETLLSTLGQSDPWVTYPDMYGYGCVGFGIIDDIATPDFRLRISFAFQHAEHFVLQYEHWRESSEHGRRQMLYDWPDSRFDVDLGRFRPGTRLEDLYDDFLCFAREIDHMDPRPNPMRRSFEMPCGVMTQFSRWGVEDQHTLSQLVTIGRWGPDVTALKEITEIG